MVLFACTLISPPFPEKPVLFDALPPPSLSLLCLPRSYILYRHMQQLPGREFKRNNGEDLEVVRAKGPGHAGTHQAGDRKKDNTFLWEKEVLKKLIQAGATGVVTALHHVPIGEVWTEEEVSETEIIIFF